MMKQETVQHLGEEETPQGMDKEEKLCHDNMSPCISLQSSDRVNYYDSKFDVLEKVKKEFSEEECFQPVPRISSRLVFENEEFPKIMGIQDVEQENQKEGLSAIINQDFDDKEIRFIVKTESPEEHRILDNAGDISNHYDVLVTPQEIQCKLCSRTFNDSYDLLQHDNEHVETLTPTSVDNEMNELNKCQFCEERFNNHNNMLAHVYDLHNSEKPKFKLCQEGIKPHGRNTEEIKYKCDPCNRVFKFKANLVSHIKSIHYDYGRTFACCCGKQFSTPIHLNRHKKQYCSANVKNANNDAALKTQFQCDICQKKFKRESYLKVHKKSIHYDYGKMFECWCGKQFRSPLQLYTHKKRYHDAKVKNANNDATLKTQFQCDICQKKFKQKSYLKIHIKSVHYDYGKMFECCCGKHFRTPVHLYAHKSRCHSANVKNANNAALKTQFQCDICQKQFSRQSYLKIHIKSIHYDYGQMFECWCGKQFRTPMRLSQHKNRRHGANVKNTNDSG